MSQDADLLLNNSNKNFVKYFGLDPSFPIFYIFLQQYAKIRSKNSLSCILLCLLVIILFYITKLSRDVNRIYVPIILVLTFK
jgi:hypothetical protein